MSPALAGGFLTAGPPGKSLLLVAKTLFPVRSHSGLLGGFGCILLKDTDQPPVAVPVFFRTVRVHRREAHREGICVYKELIHFLYSRN